MTVQEFYGRISGNYEDAIGRLMSDALIQRFVLKYREDPSFILLQKYLNEGNTQEAFRAAHTLKGVSKTLAFERLGNSASELTEILRKGDLEQTRIYFSIVEAEHERVLLALAQMDK